MIIGGGDTALDVAGHRSDAVGLARQPAEELDELGVGALADVAVARQQLRAPFIIEPLVRAQELEKLREAAFEAGLRFDFFHLDADAFHFAQADGVDLFGR